jgi:DNA helicase-2/ATP-dependent DNA helicase PcrA
VAGSSRAPALRDVSLSAADPPQPYVVSDGTDVLATLNRHQRLAVTHGNGPLIVVAGPGTGKTDVVTRRIAWLIATKRAHPREILGLTFTDNAAQEMQSRVDLLVPYGQADTHIQTFHAFGDSVLREFSLELGLPGDVRLLTRPELLVMLREHLFELGLERYRPLGDPTRFLEALVDLFLRAKDEDISPERLAEHAQDLARRSLAAGDEDRAVLADLAAARAEIATAFAAYQRLLGRLDSIDHADQIALPLQLLRERPAVRASLISRYRFLLVDEFQDTNRAQLQLVLQLAGPDRNVTVVGDADQGIYGFRGALTGNLERFAAAIPSARRVVLRRNYRSRQPIIEAAGRLLAHGQSAAVRQIAHRRARNPQPVRARVFGSYAQEADAVAAEIATRVEAGERPSDFAVLVRSNGETGEIVRSLRMRGLTVRTAMRSGLFDRRVVRALLAYLRVVADPTASLELYLLAQADPYCLQPAVLARLLHTARQRHRSLWEILSAAVEAHDEESLPGAALASSAALVGHVAAGISASAERPSGHVLYGYLRDSGLLHRLAQRAPEPAAAADARGVAQLFSLVQRRAALLDVDRVPFLVPYLDQRTETGDDPQASDPFDERVSVLTVHRAKGLEFRVVFVCGLVDGRFPVRSRPPALTLPAELAARPQGDEAHLQEERRLFYVALTRGRDEVHLSYHAATANGRGRCRPSPFVAEALDLPVSGVESVAGDALAVLAQAGDPDAPSAPRASGASLPASLSLSFSQVDDYLGCPERFRLRHVVGLPAPAHHALSYGTAMHAAVAAFHVSQARQAPLTDDELLAEFGRAWRSEGFLSREHEEARFSAGCDSLRRFRTEQLLAGRQAPVAVERPFSFRLGRDLVRGRIDRLDASPAGIVLTDYKTSDVRDQRRADARARDSLQLQVYALATQAETGRPPAELRLHFIDSGLVGHATADARRLEKARGTLTAAAEGIRRAEFAAKPNPVACGYCPYRTVCSRSAA